MEGGQQAETKSADQGVSGEAQWFSGVPPVLVGFDLALMIPVVLFLPSLVTGDLARAVDDGRAYGLLPAFAVSVLPAAALGYWIGWRSHSGRSVFQASIGAFGAGWLGGGLALWLSYDHLALGQRLLLAFAGGPALLGFWVWFGLILGGALAVRYVTDGPDSS